MHTPQPALCVATLRLALAAFLMTCAAQAQGSAPAAGTPAAAATAGDLALVGGQLFDGSGGPAVPLGMLLIHEGRVAEILPPDAPDAAASSAPVAQRLKSWGPQPRGVTVIDTTGCTVLPGLIDLHSHVSVAGANYQFGGAGTPRDNLVSALDCGVTRVLDLHADPAMIFALRERSRTDPDMATLLAAGGAFTVPGGHPTQFGLDVANAVTSEQDIETRFAKLLPWHPDAIKAVVEHGGWGGLQELPTLDLPLLASIGEHARAAHLPLLCHVWTLQEAKTAVAAKARALVHGVYIGDVDDELVAAMRKQGTAYVPTLGVVFAGWRSSSGQRPYADDLARTVLAPDIFEALNDEAVIATQALGPMATLLGGEGAARCFRNLERMADEGVTLGLGTDAGNPFTPHGPSVLYELQLYVEAGLTPRQALLAATSGNAAILGLRDVGTLQPGNVADVLVVRGDPLTTITDMHNVVDVVKGGARVDRAAHARHIAELGRAPVTLVVGTDLPARLSDGAPAAGTGGKAWSGAWEAYSDTLAPGGKSSCALSWLDDADGSRLQLQGALQEGCAWGAFGGASVLWEPQRKLLADASGFTGLRMRLRGTPRDGNLTVQCAAVKDWNVFATPLHPTEEWAVVEVPFSALHQIGFGRSVEWTGSDITGLNIEARNGASEPSYGPYSIEVDWIEFY